MDERVGKGSGVCLSRRQDRGGDAYLCYTGTCTVKGSRSMGVVLVQRHASGKNDNPLFGGRNPVGIGLSGNLHRRS